MNRTSQTLRRSFCFMLVFLLIGQIAWLLNSIQSLSADQDKLTSLNKKNAELIEKIERSEQAPIPIVSPDLFWPEGQSGKRELQRVTLEILQANAQQVRNYRQLQPATSDTGTIILMGLEFSGPLSGLLNFLDQTAAHKPPIAIQNLQVQVQTNFNQVEGETMLTTHMTVWGYIGKSNDG